MSDLVDYTEQEFLAWCFHGSDMPVAHGTVYVALHTGDPNNDGDSTTEPANQNEVAAADYSRVGVTADTSNWSMDSSSQQSTQIENATEITFGIADNDWGEITHWSLWTDQQGNGGDPLWAADLNDPKTINTNDEIRFPSGALVCDLD